MTTFANKEDCVFCDKSQLTGCTVVELPASGPGFSWLFYGVVYYADSQPIRAMIVPYRHVESTLNLPVYWGDHYNAIFMELIGRFGDELSQTIPPHNMYYNHGRPAGQTVPHLHWHFDPRSQYGHTAGVGPRTIRDRFENLVEGLVWLMAGRVSEGELRSEVARLIREATRK